VERVETTSSVANGGGGVGGSARVLNAIDRIVTVTSCRSDAYHDQRASGSTSKLPRRAPSALKTFHELAVGIKDAYEAGGYVVLRPPPRMNGGVGDRSGAGGGGGMPSSIGGVAGDRGWGGRIPTTTTSRRCHRRRRTTRVDVKFASTR
jgi:hypothetical protein